MKYVIAKMVPTGTQWVRRNPNAVGPDQVYRTKVGNFHKPDFRYKKHKKKIKYSYLGLRRLVKNSVAPAFRSEVALEELLSVMLAA